MDEGEAEPGRDHQQRSAQEQQLTPEAVGDETDHQRQGGRAEEGRRRHRADLEPAESKRGEVEGQEHADETIAERAHSAGAEEHPGIRRCLRWQQRPTREPQEPSHSAIVSRFW